VWWIVAIVALVVVFALVARSRGRQAPTSVPGSKRHFTAQVHGIEHRNDDGSSRQAIIRRCAVGEQLSLVPDPGNKYDPDAIAIVRKNGEQLGYWSGGDARMADELAAGKKFIVTIDEIYPFEEDSKKHGVRLRVDVL